MKKYIIILAFISLIFTGCSKNLWQDMSFTQASSIFFQDSVLSHDFLSYLWFTWNKTIDLFVDVFWENKDFKLDSEIELSGMVVYDNPTSQTTTYTDINFLDKHKNRQNYISWVMSNKIIDQKLYSILDNFYLNIGSGNYQTDLFKMIAQNLQWERIESKLNTDQVQKLKDISFIFNIISSGSLFNYTETTTYDGLLAYKIQLNSNSRDMIFNQTKIQINNFDCLLVVHSNSRVELKLQQVEFKARDNQNSIKIKWSISHDSIYLTMTPSNKPQEQLKLWLEQHKKYLNLSIENLLYLQKMTSLNLKLNPKINRTTTIIQLNWVFSISPLIVYWSDLEKNIEININGQYYFSDIKDTDKINISKPESFVLGSQILWDSYSLETLISQ